MGGGGGDEGRVDQRAAATDGLETPARFKHHVAELLCGRVCVRRGCVEPDYNHCSTSGQMDNPSLPSRTVGLPMFKYALV